MTQQIIEVTEQDIQLIFAELHNEFHYNILFCGFITEIAADALHHMATEHQTELDFMAADLEAMQSGERPMWRLTPEQMAEIEDEQIGADTIAPYIAF